MVITGCLMTGVDDDDEVSYVSMGGAIKSPSNVECFCQACQQGMSRYDTAALADRDYHGGVRGFDPLTIRIIKNCGYTAAINPDNIILCYRDIIHLHQKTLEGWTNSVERIMERAMPLFQKLEGIMMADLVHFFDTFQKTGSDYLLPLMPFDAVTRVADGGLTPKLSNAPEARNLLCLQNEEHKALQKLTAYCVLLFVALLALLETLREHCEVS